jgi:hypothetical protein
MKVDPKLVQEMLRHQNLKTTLEVYAKALTEDKIEAEGCQSSLEMSPYLTH